MVFSRSILHAVGDARSTVAPHRHGSYIGKCSNPLHAVTTNHPPRRTMQYTTHEPESDFADRALFLRHWKVKEVNRGTVQYDLIDALGKVVASGVKSLELARLFALAPFLFEALEPLEGEGRRALFQMLDVMEGSYDVDEIAEDVNGEWEMASPGAPRLAALLTELRELREAVGDQQFPPSGIAWQGELFDE